MLNYTITGYVLIVLVPLLVPLFLEVCYDHRKPIALWLRRWRLRLFPVNFNLALSIEFDEGLNSGQYFQEIKKSLQIQLDNAGLSKFIILKDFSDIHKFENKQQAQDFLLKKNISLIIWGEFSKDGLKRDGELVSNINLNFTYGHPDTKDGKIGPAILLDISSSMALKNYWEIVDSRSLQDVEIISSNIFDIAMCIVALTFKLYGKIDRSVDLFERLYSKLTAQQDDFRQQIIPHLMNCYFLMVTEIGIKRKNFPLGRKYCERMLLHKPGDYFALSNLAVFQYKTGDEKGARESVEKLLSLYPGRPITEVDAAFFCVLREEYENVFGHYCVIERVQDLDFDPLDVVEFLYQEYKLSKEPALLYGAGVISYYHGDLLLAQETFRKFLKLANERIYGSMCGNAQKLLDVDIKA